MSGKHDKSLDGEQSQRVLMTGPIIVRGFGRSVKDAFRPGRPSRHRALIASDETEGVDAIESALVRDGDATTHEHAEEDPPFPPVDELTQTVTSDGPEEDRVEACSRDDGAPSGADAEPPEDVTEALEHEDALLEERRAVIDAAGEPAGTEVEQSVGTEDDTAPTDDSETPAEPSIAGVDVTDRSAESPDDESAAEGSEAELEDGFDALPPEADESLVEDRSSDDDQPEPDPEIAADEPEKPADESLVDFGHDEPVATEPVLEAEASAARTEDAAEDPAVATEHSDAAGKEASGESVAPSEDGDSAALPAPTADADGDGAEIGAGDERGDEPAEPGSDAADSDTEPEPDVGVPEDAEQSPAVADAGNEIAVHAFDADALDERAVAEKTMRSSDAVTSEGPDERAESARSDEQQPNGDESGEAASEEPKVNALPDAPAEPQRDGIKLEPDEQPAAASGAEAESWEWTSAEQLLEPAEEPAAPQDETTEQSALSQEEAALAAEPETTSAAVATSVPTAAPPEAKPQSRGRPPRAPRPPAWRSRPVRERFARKVIGIAVLLVLALVCGGLITAVVFKTQRDAARAAQEAANYTPPPLATPTPAATGPAVRVIGDSSTTTAASGITTAQKWVALVGDSLDGTVTTDTSSGMGYAAKGSSGETFDQAAERIPSNADVVVFFGGAEDSDVATLPLAKAATAAFSSAQQQAPDAKLIVVGPVIRAGVDESDLSVIRSTLKTSATIAKATWIDPIDNGWLSEEKQAAKSPTALTAADEKTIASKMSAAIKKAVG